MVFNAKLVLIYFFFKQKTAYEMRISDWSSDVCSSDLRVDPPVDRVRLDVLGTVHLGGPDQVGGLTGPDQYVGDRPAGDVRATVDHQREPLTGTVVIAVGGAVAVELRDIEVALGAQLHVEIGRAHV